MKNCNDIHLASIRMERKLNRCKRGLCYIIELIKNNYNDL